MRQSIATKPASDVTRAPRRHHLGRSLATALALVALAGGLLVAMSLVARPAPVARPAAPSALPDVLIGTQYRPTAASAIQLWAIQPGSASAQPLLDGGGQPVIAPDGRQLVVSRVMRDGDAVHVSVVALASDTLARQWETEIASFPSSEVTTDNLASVGASLAVTANRVYASPSVWGARDPLTVVVLDRATGREEARWSLGPSGESASAGANLYASPDGATLYLLDSTFDAASQQTTAPVYLRVNAANGQLQDRHELPPVNGQPLMPYGSLAPDGRTLYSVGGAPSPSGGLAIALFDLAGGQWLPSLDLPLQGSGQYVDHEEGVSPDGRTLYVLAPSAGELAVVDLQSRTVVQLAPVEGLTASATSARQSLVARVVAALRGVLIQPAAAKFYFSGDMQLSPDGKRLYAVGVKGDGYEAMPTGILALDTTTWRVTDRWLPNAQVTFLQLAADGHTLAVQTMDSAGKMTLLTLDTTTGSTPTVAEGLPGYASSLRQLYRERYGSEPGAGATPMLGAPTEPVARLDVALDRTSILAGDRVTVDARFVDPRDGKLLTPDQAGVRFSPPRRVTATFYHGQLDADAVVVELQPAGFGHYRGSVSLTGPQVWSLQVDATRDNGPGSRASLTSAVVVQAAFAASDGHRYLLQLTSEPASPVAGQPVTLHLAFVDAASRQPLPEGVNLSEGLPDSIDVALFLGNGDLSQAREMHACTLRPDGAGRGVYTGGLTLDQPGGWAAQISFALGGQAVRALAGSIQVGAP